MFETDDLRYLDAALKTLEKGFSRLPEFKTGVQSERLVAVLQSIAQRLQDNFPYPHPLYAGQMLKPPHPVARLAYMLALYINPNNHALDGGRASSAMENLWSVPCKQASLICSDKASCTNLSGF